LFSTIRLRYVLLLLISPSPNIHYMLYICIQIYLITSPVSLARYKWFHTCNMMYRWWMSEWVNDWLNLNELTTELTYSIEGIRVNEIKLSHFAQRWIEIMLKKMSKKYGTSVPLNLPMFLKQILIFTVINIRFDFVK